MSSERAEYAAAALASLKELLKEFGGVKSKALAEAERRRLAEPTARPSDQIWYGRSPTQPIFGWDHGPFHSNTVTIYVSGGYVTGSTYPMYQQQIRW